MLNKYFFYLLICLLCLSIEKTNIKELKQYGKKTVYEETFLYLSLEDFYKGDEVYIELEFDDKHSRSSMTIYYQQSDTYTEEDFEYFEDDFEDYKSKYFYKNGNNYTFYYTIDLKKKTDYLLLVTPDFDDELIVKHTKSSGKKKILIGVGIVLIILIIIAIIMFVIWRVRRKKQTFLITKNLPNQNNPQQFGNQLYAN